MKRANGEGTAYKCKKTNSWVFADHATLVNGKKKRIYATGKTKEIARERLRDKMKEAKKNLPGSGKNWTVADYLDYWMHEIHKDIRETTRTSYSVMIKNHIKPTMGGHKLKDFSVYNLRTALDLMENEGRSARVRLECIRILSVCLNYAMSEEGGELVSRNVAQLIKRPRYEAKETVIWTEEQAALF